MTDVTRILEQVDAGDEAASKQLFNVLYDELRRLADLQLAGERPGNTLQPTALVNEAYLRLVDKSVGWASRAHFFRVAARTMRRILVDRAREKGAVKRGGGWRRLTADDASLSVEEDPGALLDLDEALEALRGPHPLHAELVCLRFFSGLTLRDAAGVLGLPPTSADRAWAFARAWLAHRLERR
ncbi:ECF-type sigma factor [Engelhardtia mirabilis]|uniref:ECF sigma factor n=1 Tax=Engelhardtia mirabilis TaxID=2528011 RepID=A0A518BRR0_9BACT|nr:ECF sigma factor [Planctomycetes bacterium Pla133]QDV03984.1 ECF sigma factor [Planctomycetes bacterium Pla86]